MHPAASVIFFTVASGAGYGLLAIAGVAAAAGLFEAHGALGIASLTLALLLVTAGLVSSTFHLGHPERAWRALTQWRSSWLSREGVAAVATYLPAGLLWLSLVVGVRGGGWVQALGLASALGAAITVWCTGQIYATLRPIREWRTPWTVPVYLGFAFATGALLWRAAWALVGPGGPALPVSVLALAGLALAAAAKLGWVAHLRAAPAAATRESAIGLAGRGRASVLDPPHTGTNYLLQEMGYRVARRHAERLMRLMWWLAFALPAALLLAALAWPPLSLLAVLAALLGAVIERWLFFATATHTVTLYYR